jgi:hypothetical protein
MSVCLIPFAKPVTNAYEYYYVRYPMAEPATVPTGKACDSCGNDGAKLLYLPQAEDGVYLCHDCSLKALRLLVSLKSLDKPFWLEFIDIMSKHRKKANFACIRGGRADEVKPA